MTTALELVLKLDTKGLTRKTLTRMNEECGALDSLELRQMGDADVLCAIIKNCGGDEAYLEELYEEASESKTRTCKCPMCHSEYPEGDDTCGECGYEIEWF